METQLVLAPPNNVFVDPGYHKAWTYQHLDALQYICQVVTVYCLQPKDVFFHAGRKGLKLVRELLEKNTLRVVATEGHFELIEKANLSEIQDVKLRGEVKSLTQEFIQRSRYKFFNTLHTPTVRSLPNDFRLLSVEFAVQKVLRNSRLKDYFSHQVERYRNQLPEYLQPDILPRNGLLPLPRPLKNMPDEELRVCNLPYAFFGDWLVMHQADVHIPLNLHPKWDEWYWKCWESFAMEMPRDKWPMQVLKTAKPIEPTKKATPGNILVPAMAELVHMVRVEARLKPEQFRNLGGLQVLQNNVLPILMNSFSTYSSADDRKSLTESIFQTQRKQLKQLFDDIGCAENNQSNIAWRVIKGLMFPMELLSALLKAGGWPPALASTLLEGAYFLWRYRDNSKRSNKLRSAARERGIWLGLLVNARALEVYRKLRIVEE